MDILSRIEAINQAKGNEKITELKKCKDIKGIFKYAYDPFKKFYITSEKSGLDMLQGTPDGMDIFFGTRKLLDDLSQREITGHNAIEAVCDHMVGLNPNAAEVFKRIIDKDLRCGINIKTINKVFPGLIPLVWDGSQKPPFALCKTFDPKKAKYPLLVAIKKDGVRGQKIDKMISRQGKPLVGHNHIESVLDKFAYDMDGELCVPGMIFDEASGLIRNDDPTPNSVFWIFDSPSMPGTKMERYKRLENVIPVSMTDTRVALIKHYLVKNETELMKFYNWAITVAKEEGIVIYNPDQEYEDGRIWWRLVPIKSEDLKVIGFEEGKGKFAGSLGKIIVDYKGHEVKVGTGFKEKILKSQENQLVTEIDKNLFLNKSKKLEGYSLQSISHMWLSIRDFIWANQDLFMGLVAKIEYKEKTKAGSLRQPRFKGWRFDKS